MVEMMILAAALYVCPGDVYTDKPMEGCKPFKATGQEGFSTVTETPTGADAEAGPGSPGSGRGQGPGGNAPGANSEMCALYKEYVELEVRTQGGVFMESTEQTQRWQTLKRMFQNSPAPNCP